jgi:hypothetical protein
VAHQSRDCKVPWANMCEMEGENSLKVGLMSWPEVAEREMGEAHDKSLGDDLVGKGRPRSPSTNPSLKPEWETAYRSLNTSGLAPNCMELDTESPRKPEAFPLLLARQLPAAGRRCAALATNAHVKHDLQGALQRTASLHRERAQITNKKVELTCLRPPVAMLHGHKIRIDEDSVRSRQS